MTCPGIPMLFQGQEFLQDRWFVDSVPLDWSRKENFEHVLNAYRDLIYLRNNAHGNTKGLRGHQLHIFQVNHEKKVLAFRRWWDGGKGDDTLVVINLSNEPMHDYRIGTPEGGNWYVRFNSGWKGYGNEREAQPVLDTMADGPAQDGYNQSCLVSLKPYSAIILSQ